MRRRKVLAGLAGMAASWPLDARAQQPRSPRRIVYVNPSVENPGFRRQLAAFEQALGERGWTVGRDLQIETLFGGGTTDFARLAADAVAGEPDVLVAYAQPIAAALGKLTRTIPIVFAPASDPVALGLVASLARPGSNLTGFGLADADVAGKWLDLLKQAVPSLTRVAVLRDLRNTTWQAYASTIDGTAPRLGLRVTWIGAHEEADYERVLATIDGAPDGALIVLPSTLAFSHRERLGELAVRRRLPTIYYDRAFVASGGMMSYGADLVDLYRRAAAYVDRVLRGEHPGDLPVQQPTKYELLVNLKAAAAAGVTVPPTILTRADEVIE